MQWHHEDPLLVKFSGVEKVNHLPVPFALDEDHGTGELGERRPAETKLEAELASAGDDIGAIYRRQLTNTGFVTNSLYLADSRLFRRER